MSCYACDFMKIAIIAGGINGGIIGLRGKPAGIAVF
jgi:hypothetical protein